ncbi:MAG TPA: hypothetical protein VIH61_01370 [Waddliaceae bacterium]
MKNLLHFKKNANDSPARDTNTHLYKGFFEFLINQISVPRNAEQLIELGYKLYGKTTEEVFHVI